MYVYVIGQPDDEQVKVGVSSNPARRLATLQTSNSSPLEILRLYQFADRSTANKVESALHSLLSDCRVLMEWFNTTPEKVDSLIDALRPLIPGGVLVATDAYRVRQRSRSSLALAIRWLRANPALVDLSSRMLEQTARPDGQKLDHMTWYKAQETLKRRRIHEKPNAAGPLHLI